MKTVFKTDGRVGDLVKLEEGETMPPDQDQNFVANLYDNGVLSIRYYTQVGVLVSRINLPLKEAQAVEAFRDEKNGFYLLRVNGSQVPLILTTSMCEEFMNALDALKH